MAGVDVGSSGGRGKRPTNSDINMIPFIDLLMVTIAFLLITAVWVTSSRIDADANVPGQAGCGAECPPNVDRVLHVYVGDSDFNLEWRQGKTVTSSVRIPKGTVDEAAAAGGMIRYQDLAKRVDEEWTREGVHRDPGDRAVDEAVLHTADATPFKEIVAVLDAMNTPHRELRDGAGASRLVPAFHMVFSDR